MMHGRGKSDSAIVAGKPTNKAGQPAAEPVEQRAEAKGNASQQSTRRAQDRASVSQALERIRQVARQRKKERFTSLFHHTFLGTAGPRAGRLGMRRWPDHYFTFSYCRQQRTCSLLFGNFYPGTR